jgi:hypothetical protein
VTETVCQAPCQAAVATSLSELVPECASAGAVSMLAWGARVQPVLPNSSLPRSNSNYDLVRLMSSNQ